MAPSIKVGDTIPQHTFPYISYTPELDDLHKCGPVGNMNTDDWKNKKVVIFSVPGAFTPTCHIKHLPEYLERYNEFKEKGVDLIAVVASNDAWVMSGWLRSEGVQDKIVGLTDFNSDWSRSMGLDWDLTAGGLGLRTARYAMIIDNLIVKYVEVEPGSGVTTSGALAVLAQL